MNLSLVSSRRPAFSLTGKDLIEAHDLIEVHPAIKPSQPICQPACKTPVLIKITSWGSRKRAALWRRNPWAGPLTQTNTVDLFSLIGYFAEAMFKLSPHFFFRAESICRPLNADSSK
jgi:hypothetical protein